MKIDNIDKKILSILQKNAKITNAKLSKEIGLSPAPTLERVRKLETQGIISGYHAKLNMSKIGLGVSTFVMVTLKGHNKKNITSLIDKIKKVENIVECHHITGSGDFILRVVAKNIESYGLSPNNIIGLVSSNSQLVTAGAMEQSGGRLVLKVPAVIEDLEELKNMPIKVADNTTLKFGDIASIRRVFSDANGWSRVNGKASVVLEVKKRIGYNLLEVVEGSKKTINLFQKPFQN